MIKHKGRRGLQLLCEIHMRSVTFHPLVIIDCFLSFQYLDKDYYIMQQ